MIDWRDYAFPSKDAEGDGPSGLTKREFEMIAYRASALTGWLASWPVGRDATQSDTLEDLAASCERAARATYAAAHPEESDK